MIFLIDLFFLINFLKADFAVGKREVSQEMLTRGFIDILGYILIVLIYIKNKKFSIINYHSRNFMGQVINPAVTTSLQTVAGLLAQVTAGVAIDGIPALQGLFGK
jgi:hypothetical protein